MKFSGLIFLLFLLITNVSGQNNVGVGILAPVGKLHVKGTANVSQLIIDCNSSQSNSNPIIRLRSSSGNDLLWIHSDSPTNTFIGLNSGRVNGSGEHNTALGSGSLYSNNSGNNNTAIGSNSLYSNSSGTSNTACGRYAMRFNTIGSSNTAFGMQALQDNTSGSGNSAHGAFALIQNENGHGNTADGNQALRSNSSGNENTAVGKEALYSNETGDNNSSNGAYSLHSNTSGIYNSAHGHGSLHSNTIGNSNTAVGYNSLYYNETGNNNTAFGRSAYFDLTGLSNTNCLGYTAGGVVDASNRVEIGNTSITSIAGEVSFTTYSDVRIKDNIREDVPGISFINKLRPVTYNLNIHRQNAMVYSTADKLDAEWEGKYDIEKMKMSGFIAQEVESAANELDYDFSGVDAPANPQDLYGLRYSEFVVPLVKAVQELSEKNTAQEAINEKLKTENANLLARIERLETLVGLEKE